MKKTVALLLSILMIATMIPFTAVTVFAEGEVVTISGDATISGESSMIDVVSDATVTLDSAVVIGTGRSAIFVKNNANVTFVLQGESVVTGDNREDMYSCGIEVEYGSSVTFEGDGALKVSGGYYGAGIGSYGTRLNIPDYERRMVGEITINSGNIEAYGGENGAGIGTGYHVSGNTITINGGIVHAYGTGLSSGIGTGYGTSGGAIGVAAVGEYDAGNIIITGGEIYASAYYVDDIENFDYSDLAALNTGDKGKFSAGIGGGYGSSASNIVISGGKVFALGSCGGAGIGGGRGTSKIAQINPDLYSANIRICGDAEVTAITASSRDNEIDGGGAAIGAGRGTYDCCNVEILDHANVKAISASMSPAIGVSACRQPYVYPDKSKDPNVIKPITESITIGDNVTLYAVSMGEYAVDKNAKSLSISDEYFGSSDRYFFGEGPVAISDISNVKAESTKGEKTYTVPTGSVSLWANIVKPEPVVPKTNLKIVAPLAMAVRMQDGNVYYSGDSVADIELDRVYSFQMCSVDWSTRDTNGEKKVHKPYETFYPNKTAQIHTNHGVYSDDGIGLRGTVVLNFVVSSTAKKQAWDADTKTFTIPKGDAVLRTDVNKCFMAYRFHFSKGDYNKQTGIPNVIYDTGKEHENTLEDFRYNKPLESLSVNLPLGATVHADAYINYTKVGDDEVFIEIDSDHPDRCYTDYYWPY